MRKDPQFADTEILIPLPDFSSHGIKVEHFFVGKGYAKTFDIPAGKIIGQHKHIRDHNATLLLGHVILTVNHVRKALHAPCTVKIDAYKEHTIQAVSDSLWACLWDNPLEAESPTEFDRTVVAQ